MWKWLRKPASSDPSVEAVTDGVRQMGLKAPAPVDELEQRREALAADYPDPHELHVAQEALTEHYFNHDAFDPDVARRAVADYRAGSRGSAEAWLNDFKRRTRQADLQRDVDRLEEAIRAAEIKQT